jgi:hypothetical protein
MTADPSTGAFVFPDLPRESKVGVDVPGGTWNVLEAPAIVNGRASRGGLER